MKKEKTLKQHGAVVKTLFNIATILMLIALILPENGISWVFLLGGIAVMILGLIYREKHFKCPHCGGFFSRSETVPDFCPHCGKKLG